MVITSLSWGKMWPKWVHKGITPKDSFVNFLLVSHVSHSKTKVSVEGTAGLVLNIVVFLLNSRFNHF